MVFFKLFQICMFKDINLAENWTNLAENLNKIEFCRTLRNCLLKLCIGTIGTIGTIGNTLCINT